MNKLSRGQSANCGPFYIIVVEPFIVDHHTGFE
jgi:hypothetical protein